VSPVLLARLRAMERTAQQWRRDSFFFSLAHGDTPRLAHFYSDRSAWPDALSMVQLGLSPDA
jgi:hypothetical protein